MKASDLDFTKYFYLDADGDVWIDTLPDGGYECFWGEDSDINGGVVGEVTSPHTINRLLPTLTPIRVDRIFDAIHILKDMEDA